MTKYVYILAMHEGYGAEDVRATMDRDKLPELVEAYDLTKEDLDDAKLELSERLKMGDETLADLGGYPIQKGWGGLQFHVVALQ